MSARIFSAWCIDAGDSRTHLTYFAICSVVFLSYLQIEELTFAYNPQIFGDFAVEFECPMVIFPSKIFVCVKCNVEFLNSFRTGNESRMCYISVPWTKWMTDVGMQLSYGCLWLSKITLQTRGNWIYARFQFTIMIIIIMQKRCLDIIWFRWKKKTSYDHTVWSFLPFSCDSFTLVLIILSRRQFDEHVKCLWT